MARALTTLFLLLLLPLSALQMGCTTTVQVRQTLKEHRIIVRPGNNLRSRTLEEGDGSTRYMETQPSQGDTLMIIVRGKL